jgi:hypothetical protein
MKKLLLPFLALAIIIGCQKSQKPVENLEFIKTIYSGCNDHDTSRLQNRGWEPDTSYYTLENGNLDIFVGFTANCAMHFTADSYIRNDTIFMDIDEHHTGLAGCVCYFTFDFLYEGITKPHHYVVNVADFIYFYGYIEP